MEERMKLPALNRQRISNGNLST